MRQPPPAIWWRRLGAFICHSGAMPRRMLVPAPALRPLVQMYRIVEESTLQPERHMLLPEHTAHLIVHSGGTWVLGPGGVAAPLPLATLSGLTLTPAPLVSGGPTRALWAELYPWAARQLLGWSYPDPPLDLSTGAGGPALSAAVRAISAALAAADWDTAVGLLEGWLLARAAQTARAAGPGVRAAVRLYHSTGQARVADLAAELDLSPRTLERQFAQEVGIGAKSLARLIRFETAHNLLSDDPQTPLATLAYDLGFSDQAHLTREFRALGGLTPGAYARLSRLRRALDPGAWLPGTLGDKPVWPPLPE